MNSYLNLTYGDNKWIEHYADLQLYLDHDLIKKNDIDLNEMRDVASSFINDFNGVQLALPSYQLEQGSSANGLLEPLYKSYSKSRSGDFLFVLKEGWHPIYKFKKINYTDQSHIPLVFYGGQIKSLETSAEVSATGMHDKTGVLVVEVPIFGQAPDFELQKGDVILMVNDIEVKDASFFLNEKSNPFENGMDIKTITVWRNQGRVVLQNISRKPGRFSLSLR